MIKLAAMSAVLLLCLGTVEAQPRGLHGRAALDLDVAAFADVTDTGEASEATRDGSASIGLAIRALIGVEYVHYAIGFGYRLGATTPGGFLYQLELLPVGLGFSVSDYASIGVYAGLGFSGVTSHVPFAGIVPVETRVDFRLGKRVFVGGFGRAVWTTGDKRNDGSSSVTFADEMAAGLRVRWSKYYSLGGRGYGTDGYYLAALIEESVGVRMIGAAFGYSQDFGLK